jgi:hypothetical protein
MEDTEGTIATREQILALLSDTARSGHTGAARLLLAELRRDADAVAKAQAAAVAKAQAETPGIIAELADKRKPPAQ